MISNLKILILEDNQNDADLLHRELKKSGLNFTSQIVQTRQSFEDALQHFNPDIILSDYALPAFDAVTAFRIKQNKSPHIPFIIVSGIIGEENAVELIKNGVTDYTPKNKLFTLPPKIKRALKDTEERKEKEIIGEKLKAQAAELIIANTELVFQNEEKEKRAADLILLTEALKAQKEALRNANEELQIKAQLLQQQEEKLIKTNDDLLRLNQHLENRVSERTFELENLNYELKDLNLSKDKFLSVISHDLRNPLTALLLASDQLSQDINNHVFEEIQPFAKIIHRTSHNILQQLNELVDWAKMQKEKTSLNPEKLQLVLAVDQSFELLKTNASQKSIILENKVPFDIYAPPIASRCGPRRAEVNQGQVVKIGFHLEKRTGVLRSRRARRECAPALLDGCLCRARPEGRAARARSPRSDDQLISIGSCESAIRWMASDAATLRTRSAVSSVSRMAWRSRASRIRWWAHRSAIRLAGASFGRGNSKLGSRSRTRCAKAVAEEINAERSVGGTSPARGSMIVARAWR